MVEVTEAHKFATALIGVERFTADGNFHPDYLAMLDKYRQAGVQQGLDMAAAVVERRKVAAAKAFDHAVEVRHHEHQTRFACQHREAEECEAELSKLGGGDA